MCNNTRALDSCAGVRQSNAPKPALMGLKLKPRKLASQQTLTQNELLFIIEAACCIQHGLVILSSETCFFPLITSGTQPSQICNAEDAHAQPIYNNTSNALAHDTLHRQIDHLRSRSGLINCSSASSPAHTQKTDREIYPRALQWRTRYCQRRACAGEQKANVEKESVRSQRSHIRLARLLGHIDHRSSNHSSDTTLVHDTITRCSASGTQLAGARAIRRKANISTCISFSSATHCRGKRSMRKIQLSTAPTRATKSFA